MFIPVDPDLNLGQHRLTGYDNVMTMVAKAAASTRVLLE